MGSSESSQPEELSADTMSERHFIESLRTVRAPMRAMILHLTQTPDDVDDVLQDTHRALWRKIDDYKIGEPFLPWALGFARLQSMAYLKKRGRDRKKLRSFAVEAIESALARQHAPAPQSLALEHCVALLTDRQRDLLHRRYHLGYSIREIAALEDQSSSRQALYKTFQRLHQTLLHCLREQENSQTT